MFTDLAFDTPIDVNNTPDDPLDDVSVFGGPTALTKVLAAASFGQQVDMSAALQEDGFTYLPMVEDKWEPIMNAIVTAPGQALIESGADLDATNTQLKALAASGIGALPGAPGKILDSLGGFSKWLLNAGKSAGADSLLDALLPTDHQATAQVGQMQAIQALEGNSTIALYQAISTGNYWGDPPIYPQDFIDAQGRGTSFLDADGQVTPYSQMDSDQRSLFEQYVTGKTGLGKQTHKAFSHLNGVQNDAEDERQEASNDG